MPKGAQVADGVTGVRKAVREQIAAGADWIKVYADYRRRPGDPSTPTFSEEELDALVDEATSAGLPVSAHASTPEGIRRAVEAGVATIEHGTGATPEVLARMRERGVVLCPTLAAYEAIARYGGWQPGEPEPERLRQARRMFRDALAAGVTIANGSDVGVFSHGENARELELMVGYGMTPAQALAAATSVAARVLGRADLGVIAEGATADLVALARDPLEDISALRGVVWVAKEGRVVVEEVVVE
jgi:imidazolonepropionase-like amidohydrolase